ncbi:MAG TPA: transglycosylase domain-containing protein [Bryobacteraceae bacterium]|nr:transglycosylase domain-containing protein [Bryobacteraceae bacterium]
MESLVFRIADRHLSYQVAEGPSQAIHYPAAGPYDWSLGYARMPDFLFRLQAAGFHVDAQAQDSQLYSILARGGVYPIYREKDQAGLNITDRDGRSLFAAALPRRIYPAYSDIPPLVVNTLLFIENRHMLDSKHPNRNPAVEWDRLMKAVLDYGVHLVDPRHPVIGGSTLATQLEKMRHSPGGRTHSPVEKFRQMTSATLAAYQQGIATLDAQQEIVRDYINAIPLAASAGYGDVEGLGDGLWVWYGADIAEVDQLLLVPEENISRSEILNRARAYREVLSLLLALRAPGHYLLDHPERLASQTDRYLVGLYERGIISAQLRDAALKTHVQPLRRAPTAAPENFVENKAANTIRTALLPLLGLPSTYELDRLDLTVHTTLDQMAQQGVTRFFERIADPKGAQAAGLGQYQLLEQSDPSKVVYSFTLYERGPGVNLLRVQTDNLNQPLNINQETKLELGSTAKLRTMITYLEIIAALHQQYTWYTPEQLKAVATLPDDHLTEWALKYLAAAPDRSLKTMLEAALERKYSGNPGETFFTAGGAHHFENFERLENGQMFTVDSAFENSVNLAFIRLMRDVVNYYRFRVPGASQAVLEDSNDPARQKYLARFADQEGRLFLGRFYDKYRGQTPDQALETMVRAKSNLTPLRAAVIYRSVRPEASLDQFTAFLKAHLPPSMLGREDPAKLYAKYGPDKFNLSDRGYLGHVHPLELWMLGYLHRNPQAHLKEVWANSGSERQEVYWWLFRTGHKSAQDNRIRTLLEQDAFREIWKSWKRQGYPFVSLVPSYATTIGVSGDTPAALAELAGIVMNDGVRYPAMKIDQLHFGRGTPTETVVSRDIPAAKRVVAPEIAALVRREMIGVVEKGTGRRALKSIMLSNGKIVPVGGKTGTGDNRLESFSASGHVTGSKVVNRTATFVFMVGDRFFGTIIAYVPGPKAASYRFTSALAVQIFKDLAPQMKPLIESTATPSNTAENRYHQPPRS